MGLAPTTSTTATMAMGDALAVALLEVRGFSAEDFRTLHPGGSLGRRVLLVQDILHTDAPLVSRQTTMGEALVQMTAKSFGCIGVVEPGGQLCGIVTDGDLRRHMGGNLLDRPVEAIMTANPRIIRPRALAAEALGVMNEHNITSLFVVDPDDPASKPAGIVHVHDCLRAGLT